LKTCTAPSGIEWVTTICRGWSFYNEAVVFSGFSGAATVGPACMEKHALAMIQLKTAAPQEHYNLSGEDFVKAELRSPRSGCGLDKIRRTGTKEIQRLEVTHSIPG